jgi:hypothetical protein
LLELARGAANKIAADQGHFFPSRIAIGEIKTLAGSTRKAALTYPEIKVWHVMPYNIYTGK